MTSTSTAAATGSSRAGNELVLASRGDALTPYLHAALARRYPGCRQLDPELTRAQRFAVAATTVRPTRERWAEQFYKSGWAHALRSANAHRRLPAGGPGPVLQVHALFEVPGAPTVLYVDCTHRQSARLWPAWNPLRGRALARWYARETRAYLGARHVFAFCEATRASLVEDYGVPAARVTVVGAGINALSAPAARTATPDGPPTVLFVGNDFVRKGGPTLLAAFATVRRQVPDARLVLVGTPPHVPRQPGVEVLGRVRDRERLLALYRAAWVFALPSIFDPFPLVLLEAMAHGVPCVATAACGVVEALEVGRDVVLVRPGAPDELATALVDLLEHPARATALGAAGRERVTTELTWDRVVERMAPVLDELLGA